jgi:hypothetical protein
MTDVRPVAEMRHALLDLHKALLDAQRVRYEREHGRISTANEFLGLVLEHPAFAWLRTLSALIARLDEWMEGEEKAPANDLPVLVDALRSLIEASGSHPTFSRPYWELVNAEPAVLVEHVKLSRLLPPASAGAAPRREEAPPPG